MKSSGGPPSQRMNDLQREALEWVKEHGDQPGPPQNEYFNTLDRNEERVKQLADALTTENHEAEASIRQEMFDRGFTKAEVNSVYDNANQYGLREQAREPEIDAIPVEERMEQLAEALSTKNRDAEAEIREGMFNAGYNAEEVEAVYQMAARPDASQQYVGAAEEVTDLQAGREERRKAFLAEMDAQYEQTMEQELGLDPGLNL